MRELSEHLAAQICGITHGSIRGRPFVSLLFPWLRPAVLEDSEACISLIRRNTCWARLTQACIFHFSVVNLYVVVVLYFSPGFKTTDGNLGWFGESGKCCVSRQKAERRA